MLRRSVAAFNVPVTVYRVLRYDYVPDVLEKRPPHRQAHLSYITGYKEKGMVKMGGAFDPAAEGAMIVMKGTREEVEEFARNDPYVREGLVTKWSVRDWNVVVEE
eukprot:TRINITY_DN20378_c0_g1_i1.p2 TRINITY_DN20378_c0_g1~~TRINITY_DN20378_c0_g1_i1.p2  ORF type:complete len:105 (+),score=18.58 TRINITY_DN20378_c0_g1_i1:57-371(+)